MTTTSLSHTSATRNWPAFATAAIGISSVLTAIGTFWSPLSDYESTRNLEDFYSWLVCVAITLVGAAIVFGLVVRRTPDERAPRRAVILAVIGALSIAVFWTGLPMVFAAGAASLALVSPQRTPARVALGIAALITVGAVWLALAG